MPNTKWEGAEDSILSNVIYAKPFNSVHFIVYHNQDGNNRLISLF